jgi:excinuclease ABC subunit C
MTHADMDALLPQRCAFDPAQSLEEFARSLPAHGGVYLLCDAEDRPIQLAATQALRRAVVNRLTIPSEPRSRRADLRAITRFVRYAPGFSQFETSLLFLHAAHQLYPSGYRGMLDFGPAWFAQVNVADRLPRFVPTDRWRDRPGRWLGPFPDRSACSRYIGLLEDVFELCRYYHILQQVPYGAPCAYWEMGRCPAPCNGSISLDAYRRMMSDAAAFCGQQRGVERERTQSAMQDAAQRLDYELAGRLRQRLERIDQALAQPFRLVQDAADFRWLSVQRGGGRTRLRPFFVHGWRIEPGEITSLRQLPDVWPGWCRRVTDAPAVSEPPGDGLATLQVWLVCHYLFKSPAVAGLFIDAAQLRDPAGALQRVTERFAARPAQPRSTDGR